MAAEYVGGGNSADDKKVERVERLFHTVLTCGFTIGRSIVNADLPSVTEVCDAGAVSRGTEVYLQLELRVEGAETIRRELLADRLAFDSGDLVVWDRDRIAFRCPVASVQSIAFAPEKTVYIASSRRSRGRAATRWTPQDEVRLVQLDEAGESVESIARTLERNEGAIRARLMRLRQGLRRREDRHTDGEHDDRHDDDLDLDPDFDLDNAAGDAAAPPRATDFEPEP